MTEPIDTSEHVTDAEVVEPSKEVERSSLDRQNEVIARAAEAAITMPGVPGRDEFLALAMQARILSMSGAAPKAIRDNPAVAFHVVMIGRDLGISPSAAVTLIDVIGEGDKTTVSLSPQLLNGQLRRLKLGHIVPAAHTYDSCTAVCLSWGGALDPACARSYPEHVAGCSCTGILGDSSFTWEDAQIAGLVDSRCPDAKNHWSSNSQKCSCRQGWRTYPKRMLWWRASGYAADDYFPEAGLGLYSPEELGAVVDPEGRPIDPTVVELPPGYEPPAPKPNPARQPAAVDDLWELQERVYALPTQERADLADRWKSSRLKGAKVHQLVQGDVNFARSMVAGFEKIAARGGEWTAEVALEELRHDVGVLVLPLCVPLVWPWPRGDGLPAEPEFHDGNPEDDAPPPSGTSAQPPAEPVASAEPSDGTAGQQTLDNAGEGDLAPDPGKLEAVIAEVLAMSKDEVTAALREAGLPATGNDDTRRRRLTEHRAGQ